MWPLKLIKNYGVVTYDLAVALKAYSIQALDTPRFDKLLIMLGNFHLELALAHWHIHK